LGDFLVPGYDGLGGLPFGQPCSIQRVRQSFEALLLDGDEPDLAFDDPAEPGDAQKGDHQGGDEVLGEAEAPEQGE
jgi:hypothetical protein